jgi:hypothetical protein
MNAEIGIGDTIDVGSDLENGLYYAIENILAEMAKLKMRLASKYAKMLDDDYDVWVIGSYRGKSTRISVYKSTMRWLCVFDPNLRKIKDPERRAVITSDIHDQLLRKARNW